MIIVVALIVALATAGAGDAMASARLSAFNPATGQYEYPNQQVIDDATLKVIHAAAQKFWGSKGYADGGPVTILVADDLRREGDAVSPASLTASVRRGHLENKIWLSREALAKFQAMMASKGRRNAANRRHAVQQLYSILTHEEGHIRGLADTPEKPADVMSGRNLAPEDWRMVAKEVLGRRYFTRPKRWEQAPDGSWVKKPQRARRRH